MRDRTETFKQWLSWMDWLDRWGYITAGFSLLILGMLIFRPKLVRVCYGGDPHWPPAGRLEASE